MRSSTTTEADNFTMCPTILCVFCPTVLYVQLRVKWSEDSVTYVRANQQLLQANELPLERGDNRIISSSFPIMSEKGAEGCFYQVRLGWWVTGTHSANRTARD